MPLQNRATLKTFFEQGSRPTAGNFADLIDSVYNKLEDKLITDDESGTLGTAALAPFFSKTSTALKDRPNLFAIFENNSETGYVAKHALSKAPLFSVKAQPLANGTLSDTSCEFTVNGTVISTSRKGNYNDPNVNPDTILANGQWHKILTKLDGLNLFEVTASASGPKGQGEYAILHAVALSAFGNSKSEIVSQQARYKGLFKKMDLRWTGTTNDYNLEIRTNSNFGEGVKIKYNLIKLICE